LSTKARLAKLREQLSENEVDAILVSTPENRRYLSGFAGSAGYLLVSSDDAVLATDFRYIEQAGNQAPDFRVVRISSSVGWFTELTSENGLRRVGFESRDMTVSAHSAFQKAIDELEPSLRPELVPTPTVVEKLRAVKDEGEIKLIGRAVELADQALDEVAPGIAPGMTERAIAWELEKAMRERGADEISFDIIVGSGPNGALPHHRAGDRVIEDGDPIVIDMGATYEGYCSDLSRTVFVGEPDDKFRRVYDTVLRAQLLAEEKVTEGMTGGEVDGLARDVIVEAGHGEEFGHSLGHGVGLAVHEAPTVGPRGEEPITEGMVFTVEPGIYISGWGGVRIEDMVVLENGRARVLSKAHKLAFS
jgi:Xaa-Pro aminopeptidase